jgi:transcription initiation factor IIE alpha subunit
MISNSKSRIKEFYEEHIKKMSSREKRNLVKRLKLDLGFKSNQAFYNSKNGKSELTLTQAKVWAKLFGKTLDEVFKDS